jgi:hypothetical protein
MQCAATAAVAVGSASGIRAWLRIRAAAWLTASRMKAVSVALLSLAVIASGIGLGGQAA